MIIATLQIYDAQIIFYKEWQKNVRSTFGVGDTAWAVNN